MRRKTWAIILRGGGISGKFLLVFLLTKKISLEFQGAYTLLNTTVILLVFLLGLDFHSYTNKIIVKHINKTAFIFKNSLVFYVSMYVFLIPVLYFILLNGMLQQKIVVIFFFLVITEHLSQELFRIYIAVENVLLANILFFLRTGAWSWPLISYLFFKNESNLVLYDILCVWLFFSLFSTIFGIYYLPNIKNFWSEKIDVNWIKKGLKVGLLLFVSSVFLKVIEYSDKYLIDYFLGKKQLGIYAFYYQFSNLISVIIFTLYISYAYPKILKSVYAKNLRSLKREKKQLFKSTSVIALLFVLFSLILLPIVLNYIGKSELTESTSVIYVLIFATFFFNLSISSHFILIVEEKETAIISVSLLACLINVVLNFALLPRIGIYGASISLLISNFVLFLGKRHYEGRIISKW